MDGKVFIEDLILECHIGITNKEREIRQEIVVSIFMDIDPRKAAVKDTIQETVSYSEIHSQILDLAKTSRFNLLETLGSRIAEICLVNPLVKKVKVILKKPHRYTDTKAVGVVIEKK